MKRLRLPPKLLLAAAIIMAVVSLGYDIVKYYATIEFELWTYIHEALTLFLLLLFYFYLDSLKIFKELSVQKNLKNFTIILGSLYSFVFVALFILSPNYNYTSYPPQADSISSLIYSNFASLAAILFLIPMLFIIRNLIFYKYKKRTMLYAYLTLSFVLLSVAATVILNEPFKISFSFTEPQQFLTLEFLNSVLNFIILILLIVLSSRNGWITYLSRKEKYSYFLAALVIAWGVIAIFDLAFEKGVKAHSAGLYVLSYYGWLFVLVYTLISVLNLMRHIPTARVFDRKIRQISSLLNLSRTIAVEFDQKKLTNLISELAANILENGIVWLVRFDELGSSFKTTSTKNISKEQVEKMANRYYRQLIEKIVSKKTSVVINEMKKSEFGKWVQKSDIPIGSLAGIPFRSSKDDITGILFAAKSEIFSFDPEDVDMLEAFASQASVSFENAKLLKSSVERERLEQELQIAREVQLRLLPQKTPDLNGYDIGSIALAAYEVGGDYYDFYNVTDNDFGLIIGDVSGKGTSAAFYMAETKGIIQSLVLDNKSPKDILIKANHILRSSIEKKSFISLLTAHFDMKRKKIVFARAGHCPVLHYQRKTAETRVYQPSGLAAGLAASDIFTEKLKEFQFRVSAGDILAFYTDGLSEARNKRNEEYGEERLIKTIEENHNLSTEQLKEKIIDDVILFMDHQNLHDDLTLILVKIK